MTSNTQGPLFHNRLLPQRGFVEGLHKWVTGNACACKKNAADAGIVEHNGTEDNEHNMPILA